VTQKREASFFFAFGWAWPFFTTQALRRQGKRSGLTPLRGVVHLLMPCQRFLLPHQFLLSFFTGELLGLDIEGLSCFFTVAILFAEWKCGYARSRVKARAKARDASPRIEIPWLAAG
jgi:hypothetical protein